MTKLLLNKLLLLLFLEYHLLQKLFPVHLEFDITEN